MAQIRILSAEDIAGVFTVADALASVEDAYAQKARGTAFGMWAFLRVQ